MIVFIIISSDFITDKKLLRKRDRAKAEVEDIIIEYQRSVNVVFIYQVFELLTACRTKPSGSDFRNISFPRLARYRRDFANI